MPVLRIEPRPLGIKTCSLVTVLIVLTQLPLLETSWFVFPGSYNGKCFACNCIHFNTIHYAGLLLLISNLRNLRVSESERYADRLWPLAAAYLIILSVFRGIRKIS